MKSKEMVGKTIRLRYRNYDAPDSEAVVCSYCGKRVFICSIIKDSSWHAGLLLKVFIHEKLSDDQSYVYSKWTWSFV